MIPYEEAYAHGFEDMHRRIPDTSKVKEAIGWAPTRDLTEIIVDVIAATRAAGETPAGTA